MAKNKKTIKVKPCPFCSDESNGKIDVKSFASGKYQVVCGNCGAIGPVSDEPEKSLDMWNARTTIILDVDTYNNLLEEGKDGKKKHKSKKKTT